MAEDGISISYYLPVNAFHYKKIIRDSSIRVGIAQII
jgi:hypothetical protein